MTAAPQLPGLSDRDRRVLLHVGRYGLTTAAVAHRWLCPDLSPDAVRKSLARLAERGLLLTHRLCSQESYFVLGGPALSALGLRRPTGALGHQALVERYGVLLACARRRCDVFTEEEFRKFFPDLTRPGLSAKNFFTDASADPPRLAQILVDHDKRTDRLVCKARQRVGQIFAADLPGFHREVFAGRFAIHVVTATEGKRDDVAAALLRKQTASAPVFVEAHPELEPFFLLKRR